MGVSLNLYSKDLLFKLILRHNTNLFLQKGRNPEAPQMGLIDDDSSCIRRSRPFHLKQKSGQTGKNHRFGFRDPEARFGRLAKTDIVPAPKAPIG